MEEAGKRRRNWERRLVNGKDHEGADDGIEPELTPQRGEETNKRSTYRNLRFVATIPERPWRRCL